MLSMRRGMHTLTSSSLLKLLVFQPNTACSATREASQAVIRGVHRTQTVVYAIARSRQLHAAEATVRGRNIAWGCGAAPRPAAAPMPCCASSMAAAS
jgi:hypothetical protein